MKVHSITAFPYRLIPVSVLLLVLAAAQVALLRGYAGTDWLPAAADAVTTVVGLAVLAYLAQVAAGFVPRLRSGIAAVAGGILLWLAAAYLICDAMGRIVGDNSISFARTIPFRLLFGIPTLVAAMLWGRLEALKEQALQEEEHTQPETALPAAPQTETIDRITVKDRSRIHLIEVGELLCIQADGDYVTLVTAEGQYIQEQTMIYFETHLPTETFVRIHRSVIVNVHQIARIELFGRETYSVLLKNGTKLRASLSGYRLLKERLGL